MVPVLLGLAALVLLIVVMIRMRRRTVVDRYVFIKNQASKIQ